jgi:predicted cobalt transporter CbtA
MTQDYLGDRSAATCPSSPSAHPSPSVSAHSGDGQAQGLSPGEQRVADEIAASMTRALQFNLFLDSLGRR